MEVKSTEQIFLVKKYFIYWRSFFMGVLVWIFYGVLLEESEKKTSVK